MRARAARLDAVHVEFLVRAEPGVGCIELGKPSDETRRVVEGFDTRRALRGEHKP